MRESFGTLTVISIDHDDAVNDVAVVLEVVDQAVLGCRHCDSAHKYFPIKTNSWLSGNLNSRYENKCAWKDQIRSSIFELSASLRVCKQNLLDVSDAGVTSFYDLLCNVFICDLNRTCSGSLTLLVVRLLSG